jgi:hypothetical protein
MLVCKLCGLHIETIPDDAVLIGKLQRFSNGEFHFLRKKMEPRNAPRPRKSNPDREAPVPPPIIAREVPPPSPEKKIEEKEITEVFVPNETSMERAFRLAAI